MTAIITCESNINIKLPLIFNFVVADLDFAYILPDFCMDFPSMTS